MVKVIMGLKGSGKTKQLIELVRKAIEDGHGDIIVIERGPKLTYDISYKARLIEAGNYDIRSYEFLKGFISGIYAGNYDITDIFVDSLYKIVGDDQIAHVEDFLDWLEKFSEKENIKFTLTISSDIALASDGIRKYF